MANVIEALGKEGCEFVLTTCESCATMWETIPDIKSHYHSFEEFVGTMVCMAGTDLLDIMADDMAEEDD